MDLIDALGDLVCCTAAAQNKFIRVEREIMNLPRRSFFAIALFALCTVSAWAQTNVIYPANGAVVGQQFSLYATADSCSSQWVASMGFSLDSGRDITYVYNSWIYYTPVNVGPGAHVIHVKVWGNQGAVCVTDVAVTASGSGSPSGAISNVVTPGVSGPYVPSYAAVVSSIQALGDWVSFHDYGTYGSSNGATSMTSSPSLSGNALQLYTTYTYYGGQRYYAWFGDDTSARNFVYDGWIYLTNSSGSISNLEMDMNQVMPNGQTVIFGFQCDGWSGTWDYSENVGTPTAPVDRWVTSSAPCNVRSWAQYTWHHVQISYSRDDYGTVTYQSVWLDGNQQQINATVPSAYALGWAPTLLTNFQVGSFVPGWSSSTVYLDNLTVSRW
jgi:hypothetical protein